MSGLVLKLGPKERILINGVIIENGDRRSRFTVVTPKANILRLKDTIHPDSANTPVKYACFLAQLLLSGEVDIEVVKSRLERQMETLKMAFKDVHEKSHVSEAIDSLEQGSPYCCLKSLRKLLPIEKSLMDCKP